MARHRLLVVEDDSASQDAYRQFYSRQGWEVSVASTVREALTALEAESEPCCLILDLHLPDGDGVEVLRRVRDMGLKSRAAICTGSVDLQRLKAAAELKPDDMLPKPVCLPEGWAESCPVCAAGTAGRESSNRPDAATL